MNLVLLPDAPLPLRTGEKPTLAFPSADCDFLFNSRPQTGDDLACALFSPMGDFTSQLQALEVAHAVMAELIKPENRAETDRSADIRARAGQAAAPAPDPDAPPTEAEAASLRAEPTRRALLTGGQG